MHEGRPGTEEYINKYMCLRISPARCRVGTNLAIQLVMPSPNPLQDVPVLVVDDDAASAKLFSILLRSEGCDVRVAQSAEEAFNVLERFRPRIIVLDLILPLMSGLLFAQHIKGDPATSDIILIAVTVFNGPDAERTALSAGCSAYLRKPIDALTFAEFLAKHL